MENPHQQNLEVIDKMNPTDREMFYCDIREHSLYEHF
uniref:FAR19 n=1 Tax=Tetrastichus brontispae TaxID=2033808 RepID=A0A650FKT7_9HYME|nr:FAR19 [Tetrastichus brontispae]